MRGPKHSQRKGKTPVLNPDEARALLDSIETDTLIGLRDRALIGLMVFTFARVGATVTMKVEDCYLQGRRLWIRLHEKGGKRHEVPAIIPSTIPWPSISKRPTSRVPRSHRCFAPWPAGRDDSARTP